jgi:D-alanyl-D-alanine carboxypeptidase
MLGAAAATLASGALARALPAIAPGAQARLRAAIDDAARKAIAAKAAPGFSIAIALHGQILLQQGFGLANLETQTAITPRSIFRIGSLTKQFTAAAMARLQEQGRLKLVDPVAKYLPAFGRLPQIAINELIHHTAGLHSDDETASPAPGPEPQSQAALANAIAGQKKAFDFAPGTAWLYSNANYIVLGAIVEQVTAEPFADAIRNLVLKPLMPTTLAVDRSDLVVPGRTNGYSLDGERFANAPYIEISEAGGAGSMRGDAPDLVLWHQALIAGRIVGRDALAFLMSPGRLRDGRLASANRFSPNDANYGEVQYGGGLLLSPAGQKPRTISHNGFINGFAAVLETGLDSGVSFAVLANADVGPSLPFRDVRKAVRAFESGIGA